MFNTLLTRAKSLVVVAGSPYVLLRTEEKMEGGGRSCWKMFIKSCIDHETFIIPRSVEINKKKQSDFVDNLKTVVNSCSLDTPTSVTSINASSEPNAAVPSSIQLDAEASHFQSSSVNVESGKSYNMN